MDLSAVGQLDFENLLQQLQHLIGIVQFVLFAVLPLGVDAVTRVEQSVAYACGLGARCHQAGQKR